MTKKHHHKKRIPKLIRTRRFSALVAVLLVAVSVGLGYLWLRGSGAATGVPAGAGPAQANVYMYDRTGGGKVAIPGQQVKITVTNYNGSLCTSSWVATDAGGRANLGSYSCGQPATTYFSAAYASIPAGMYPDPSSPYKPNNQVTAITGQTYNLEFWFLANDGDKDGTPDRSDRCPTQVGPASNGGCPVPAAAPAPKPVASSAKPKATTSTTSKGSVATTAQPSSNNAATQAAPTDSTPPNPPTDLRLTSPSSGLVTLTWAAATDDTGVTRYSVERSEDKAAWEMLDDNITETTYSDAGAAYSKKYFYRVIAYDAATNASASVDAEIVTGQFLANAKPDEESTVSSEDASIAVTIPKGALEKEADCRLLKEEEAEVSLPNGAELKNGPYKLVCKLVDGSSVETFKQPVKYTVNVDAEGMGSLKPALFINTDQQWQKSDAAYNQENGGFSYESDAAQTILVAGLKQTNLIPILVGGGVAIILLIAGAIWFIRRRNSGEGDYSTDLGSASYMSTATLPTPGSPAAPAPGAVVNPVAPPASPAPNPANIEPPGQHGIHVPGEVKAPFADQQDPTMPTISHHSPLDRLDDQSTAGSSAPVDQPPK